MSSIAFSLLTLEFSTCSFPRNPLFSAALTAQLSVKATSEPVNHPPASDLMQFVVLGVKMTIAFVEISYCTNNLEIGSTVRVHTVQMCAAMRTYCSLLFQVG